MNVAIARATSYDDAEIRQAMVRLFAHLGYERENPLGAIVRPGDRVFIKPNWVAHEYRRSCPRQDSVYSTITHPAVIRVVTDFVARALEGRGEIRIGDNPSIDADFDKLRELAQLGDLETRYDVPVRILDLRPLRCADLADYGIKEKMVAQPGDPDGESTINLGRESMFHGVKANLFRGVFTDRTETIEAHSGERHLYSLSNSILKADVYISIPKLKTHDKAGTTLNLKGLVGTVSQKNLLVHWRIGWPGMGGDEYPSFSNWMRGQFEKVKHRGAWPGNDTVWRTVVDLYNAFGAHGTRRTFSVVDGIVGGEGDGPFCPVAKNSDVLLAGEDLLAVDCVASRLMGFDLECIQYLRHLITASGLDLASIGVVSSDVDTDDFFDPRKRHLDFEPPTLWEEMRRTVS